MLAAGTAPTADGRGRSSGAHRPRRGSGRHDDKSRSLQLVRGHLLATSRSEHVAGRAAHCRGAGPALQDSARLAARPPWCAEPLLPRQPPVALERLGGQAAGGAVQRAPTLELRSSPGGFRATSARPAAVGGQLMTCLAIDLPLGRTAAIEPLRVAVEGLARNYECHRRPFGGSLTPPSSGPRHRCKGQRPPTNSARCAVPSRPGPPAQGQDCLHRCHPRREEESCERTGRPLRGPMNRPTTASERTM